MKVALSVLILLFALAHGEENATKKATFLLRGLTPNENSNFDERAYNKLITKQNLNIKKKKPSGKRAPQANAGSSQLLDSVIEGQIVGGSKARKGQFPWQALIKMDDSYLCGGSLIDPEWVLTAAHCVFEYKK